MERIILLLLCALCLVTIGTSLKAQADHEKRNAKVSITATTLKESPNVVLTIIPDQLTLKEYNISLYVLICGAGALLLELGLMLFKFRHPNDIIKFIVVTIVLTASLYLITAGYSLTETSPALGVLGTIAGYLLGKSEVSVNSSPQEAV